MVSTKQIFRQFKPDSAGVFSTTNKSCGVGSTVYDLLFLKDGIGEYAVQNVTIQ